MDVQTDDLKRIINRDEKLTTQIALRLAAALGNMPEFWLNIQHAVTHVMKKTNL